MTEDVRALDLLAAGGPVARLLGDAYEPRPEQDRMCEAVARAMRSKDHLLVEAGTGVGKSFAYLAPAIERIVSHSERVVIATHTIALQEQLLNKDVPMLQEAAASVGAGFKAVLVKGRGNYVSIRRLQLASQRKERLFADEASRRSLHVIEDWAYGTEDGTLSTLPALERPGVWDRVQSDSGNCMGRRCPTYDRCFYQRARREMESADLLICNHAIYFSDLALRAQGVGFLPEHQHVVLDEAHNVEDVASDHFGLSLSEGRVRRLLSNLHHRRTGRGFLPLLVLKEDAPESVESAVQAVERAEAASDRLFDALLRLTNGGRVETLRVHEPDAVENDVTHAFRALALRLKTLREYAAREEDRYELNAYAERAGAIAVEAEALVSQRVEGCVYWIETSRGGEGTLPGVGVRLTLACSPVEVGPLLRENLFDADVSVVLASATLASGGRRAESGSDGFSHAKARLGCEEATTLLLGSPFDHAAQMEVHIDRAMPDPRDASYAEALVERILDHVRATEGGAFVLFTSNATLRAVSQRARPRLESEGYTVVAQHADGSRASILERFRESDRGVLFGTASFWQGVDVRGRALRNVIITRLPFDPPDRPLTQARLERIKDRGGDPFFEDSLPRAVLRFKQGIGRLIRGASDSGRIVVLDPRIVTKSYGRAFLNAIPEGVTVHGGR
ncbi:MAG: DEAD/DEAH box helicase [Phycisphaerales bacterium]|nr:MAG: DEAD/DEAH box helicase [Phycisphaerales bacterium]